MDLGSRGAAARLVAAFGLLLAVNLGAVELSDVDEARSGVIVRDIVEGGRWLLPRTPDGYYTEKPPASYWASAGAARLFGANEWTMRGPSVLAAIGTLALAAWLASVYGSPRAAALAVAALGANGLFFLWARKAMVDMTLTFFVTAGLTAYLAARNGKLGRWPAAILAGAAFGLAVLSKGPLGLALPAAVVGGELVVATRGRPWRARGGWLPGAAAVGLAAGIALGWYLPCLLRGGREFLTNSLLSENYFMVKGDAVGQGVSHKQGWFYYPIRQAVTLLPLLPLLPETVRWAVAKGSGPARAQLASWLGFGFVLFMIASNKRMYYLLPLQPAAAAMIGLAFDAAGAEPGGSRAPQWGAGLSGAVLALAGAAAFILAVDPQFVERALKPELFALVERQRGLGALFGLAAFGVGAALMARADRGATGIAAPAVLAALLTVAGYTILIDRAVAPLNHTRTFVAEAHPKVPEGAVPVVVPPEERPTLLYGLEFYWPERMERSAELPPGAVWAFVPKSRAEALAGRYEIVAVWAFTDAARDIALVRKRK